MEHIPGLGVFAGYNVIKKVDNDVEVEVSTYAYLQPWDATALVQQGWVQRAPNVFAWLKPRYPEEAPVVEENGDEEFVEDTPLEDPPEEDDEENGISPTSDGLDYVIDPKN